ncbi:acyl-CoA carboxylase epsilon subunit [Streptomyces beijiangensis]|uniref:Acyl-CoA carboxylase subunit epsilon n=1 Tax=Streptomyces beijiangensis TaxID=163361 RepID=A0A939FAB1_9ACTN|nr:acyl-CoA carboxylase epsilon subunit [Streptomyces beijiangensis]MBO0514509.1 acyl-CoA carboxylase subunit epsilon [Streptomyces beijiangensis]
MSTPDDSVVRIERGQASPEELAALTAVLLARAASSRRPASGPVHHSAGWLRLERQRTYSTAHSWQKSPPQV